MAVNNCLILQATCLLILVLHSTWHAAEATKYCDGDFHLAVYRTCSTHKRSGGEPVFSLDDVLSMNRLRNNVRRSADSALQDEAFFMTSLQKRSEYNGIASYCCLHGCTPAELSVVC